MRRKCILLVISLLVAFMPEINLAQGQEHPYQKHGYRYPEDPRVAGQLGKWQDLKFGIMMNLGLYSIEGIVESWALVSEDQGFQDRGGVPYCEYKRWYFDLIKRFNPTKFDPAPWARAAKEAGMKYVVFDTKHHDGFALFDTKYSDFKVTGPDCPFRDHPRANIVKDVFSAFRADDFMIGAYFSKPDWHHPDYWSPLWATPNRNNNYDTGKYPAIWQRFRDYTYNQIEELMTAYGRVDILWLDGGWVRPDSTINEEVRSWGFDIAKWEQDIDMPRIAKMARMNQPGLLIVDRTVHGPYEDYRTPEQTIPGRLLPFPWETCMTMTQSWGHTSNPHYKSTQEMIHYLVQIVSRGGNYLLNIGPAPDGTFEDKAYERLSEIGRWMDVNGQGIYGTRARERFREGETICFTRSKDQKRLYAFSLKWPGERLILNTVKIQKESEIRLLGYDAPLEWEHKGEQLIIHIPRSLQNEENRPCKHAWCFSIDL